MYTLYQCIFQQNIIKKLLFLWPFSCLKLVPKLLNDLKKKIISMYIIYFKEEKLMETNKNVRVKKKEPHTKIQKKKIPKSGCQVSYPKKICYEALLWNMIQVFIQTQIFKTKEMWFKQTKYQMKALGIKLILSRILLHQSRNSKNLTNKVLPLM